MRHRPSHDTGGKEMQWSEMVAGGGLLVFFIILAGMAVMFLWRAKKLDHEERRFMIEKGMTPPPRFSGNWPQVRQHENQLRFEERRLMIEKGLLPPPFTEQGKWELDDFLRRGIVTLFLGIGLGITYYLLPETTVLAFVSPGLALFGLGCITYYVIGAKRPAGGAPR